MNKKKFFVFCFVLFLYFVLFYFCILFCFQSNVRVVDVVQGVWLNLNCSDSDEELLELDNDPVAELE